MAHSNHWATFTITACLLCFSSLTAQADPLRAFSPAQKEELAYTLGVQAFIYSYPLVHVNQFRHMFHSPDSPTYRGPANQLNHSRKLASSTQATAATPNNDTLYTLAFLDLGHESIVIETPALSERYFTIQLADSYATNFGDIGTRHNRGRAGKYLITGPDWAGDVPPGIDQVYTSPTPWAMILLRILVDNEKELEEVHVLQDQFRLTTLNGRPLLPLDSKNVPAVPASRAPEQVWATINRELTRNQPPESDQALVSQFALVGIGPGQDEDTSQLDPAVQKGLARALATGMQLVVAAADDISGGKAYNGWAYPKPNIGRYDTDYLYRAGVTRMGLMANDPAEATYISLYKDQADERLSGNQQYRLHFPAQGLPPAKAFWSITVYDRDTYRLVENIIGRHSIGDRTEGLEYGSDGSLEVNLSYLSPKSEQRANWLPVPQGDFYLIMRVYLPEDVVIEQQWAPPGVEVLDK